MTATPDHDIARRLAHARDIARQAGDVGLHYFRSQRFDIETKADGSPVTIADKESETFLRAAIEKAFPDDAILGEEFPEKPGASGFRWVIDPIDGTASFIHGVPLYGVLVGIERDQRSLAGVIHLPALDETAYASLGHGAWHTARGSEPARAHVSRTPTLREACVCMTGMEYLSRAGKRDLLFALTDAARRIRGWSDCYAHVLVATGRIDAVVDPVMNPWDSAASIIIIHEAGGRYTDFKNTPSAHTPEALITNAHIHNELLALINNS